MTFRRVVAATDFSETSAAALRAAARWSRHLGVPLVVIHSYDPAPIGPSAASPIPAWPTDAGARAIERAAKSQLAALAEGLLAGVEHTVEAVAHPNPALGVSDFAKSDDLIVVGTHGRTGLGRILMGSVAEQTLRHAPCAVLVVRGEVDPERFPTKVVACTDFSDAARPAIEAASWVAKAFAVPVTVLHAETAEKWQQATFTADDQELAKVRSDLESALGAEQAAFLPPPVRVEFIVADHHAHGIVDHAAEAGVDLIVMATHGRTGLARLVIGSVAERVTRHAPRPVLVARPVAPS